MLNQGKCCYPFFNKGLYMCENKKKIIELFKQNVKGKIPDTSTANKKHSGKEGHWLETSMGIQHNGDNLPDLLGYEMKNQTTSGKISFGDWTADEYIFISDKQVNSINKQFQFSRKDFLSQFGKANKDKKNRLSWSGTPCPTYYGDKTSFGQHLTMDNQGNIIIEYNFSEDQRIDKSNIISKNMQIDGLVLLKWDKESLKKKVEKKFNQNGWFTCLKDKDGKYEKICFGAPMSYDSWIKLFKNKIVFFDSGMYDGNIRPYSMWRAKTGYWHSLITDSY